MPRRRPNIVYIHSHDTGRSIQPYGYSIPTPNLQALAEQGVLFRNAHCAAPTCSPSRAALLTGQCAHSSGMLGLAHRGFALRDYGQHLCHTLRSAGYTTALAGVQHVARAPFADPAAMGYDRMLNHRDNGNPADHARTAAAAVEYLAGPHERPFFLDVGFNQTHRVGKIQTFVHEHAPVGDPRYAQPPAGLPDAPVIRQDMADYTEAAKVLDAKVGQVLAALDQHGLADNTLVLCTTDHGIPFPGHKCNLTDRGTGVLLILRGPGGFAGGRVIDAMVSHVDLFPTICDLLDIEKPAWLQGRSMMPLLDGRQDEINGEIFAEVTYHAAYEPQRAVRTRRWKYIRRYDQPAPPVLSNIDDSASKRYLYEQGLLSHDRGAEFLYDLLADPAESCNGATDPACGEALNDMRRRLDGWMRRTDDPLLAGNVPPPAGGIVTARDDYSPSGGWPPGLVLSTAPSSHSR